MQDDGTNQTPTQDDEENETLNHNKSSIHLATWNLNHGHNEQTLTEVVVQGQLDFVTLQELVMLQSNSAHTWMENSQCYPREHGHEPCVTRHNVTVADQERLQFGHKSTKIQHDGRVITSQFELNDDSQMHIISICTVCKGSTKTCSDGADAAHLTTAVQQTVINEIRAIQEKHPDGHPIILGNLQEQRKGKFIQTLQEMELCSPHPLVLDKDDKHIAGAPLGNMKGAPTGIDWAFACQRTLPFVTGVFIGDMPDQSRIATNHCLVGLELDDPPTQKDKLEDAEQTRCLHN